MRITLGKELHYFNSPAKLPEAEEILNYHKELLFSAYSFWNKDLHKLIEKGAYIFGDSGGFQLKSLVISNERFPLKEASIWQLTNTHVTPIRDYGLNNLDKDIYYKAVETKKSAEYLLNLRKELDSETKILGVVHGGDSESRMKWINYFDDLKFDGWALAGGIWVIDRDMLQVKYMMPYELPFKDIFELLIKFKKLSWIHFFGLTSYDIIAVLPYLYEKINTKTNYVIENISWDNTSPQKAAAHYAYYLNDESSIIMAKRKKEKKRVTVKDFDTQLPCCCKYCNGKTFEKLYNEGTVPISLHNVIKYVEMLKYVIFLYNNNKNKWKKFVETSKVYIDWIDAFIEGGISKNILDFL